MASNLVNITAYDVYNRMIELNFPEEMARLFQTEMKDGLYSYIFAAENSIVKSQNTMLIMSLIKLVASYSNPYHSKFDDEFKNMPLKLMCEPWPQSMCDVLASEVDPSRAKIMKESVLEYEQTVSSASLSQSAKTSKPMALKDLTNLPSRTQSTGSNQESCNDGQMPTVYEPSGVKVLICNEMVDLPRFSVTVENSLHIEDECFQILPKACLELVEFLWQMNIDVRTSSDYKQLARAILFKYEVLEGIISRYIVKGLLAGFPNPPKNSQDHVTKLLQKTFSSMRNSKKRQAKKFLGQLRF